MTDSFDVVDDATDIDVDDDDIVDDDNDTYC